MSNCGSGSASCCASLEVPAGTFNRSYDGFTYASTLSPATVSGLRLDQYEVTVGRFRQFVSAAVGGWLPSGKGLGDTAGGFETGWDAASWNSELATTTSGWNTALTFPGGTWKATAGSNENLPIAEPDWYESYAFCIWDGGFLPSEAEWNYAAAGGSDQRAYPWSPAYPPGSTAITCADANDECVGGVNAVGSESAGDGKWGQSDLAGNVFEWSLDAYVTSYVVPCVDCASLMTTSLRVFRGGGTFNSAASLLASFREFAGPASRSSNVGFRCARPP